MSQLLERQLLFARSVPILLEEIGKRGFQYKLGECARAPVQAEVNALDTAERARLVGLIAADFPHVAEALRGISGKVGIRNSVHRENCALDVVLFQGVQLCPMATYDQFGGLWQALGEFHCWGGDWGDVYHFSVSPDGKRK